jgi:hypothetical protein
MSAGARTAWERAQHGWPARYPVAQFPNAPLLLALAGSAVAAATDGSARDYARAAASAGLAAWAWLELSAGVNAFRRTLGAAALVLVVARVGSALGG